MRYLYVKNGDAVEQVTRVLNSARDTDPHGPDAFISSFLNGTKGNEVCVLSRGSRNASYTSGILSAVTVNGGRSPAAKLFLRVWYALRLLIRIFVYRPDRILCGSTGSQLFVCWAGARFRRIPVVHSRHNRLETDSVGLLAWMRRTLEIFLIRRVNAIVAHGPYLASQLIEHGANSSAVFEFEVSFPGDLPERSASTAPRVLFIGRVESQKGVFDLLNACKELLSRYPSLTVDYIGDGSARLPLAETVAKLGLASRVRVLGPVPHDRVLTHIAAATVVVAPTRLEFPEGRCMVAMESLALGVPVIAPGFGPFPFLVSDQINGLLFEPNSVTGLSDSIDRLLSDSDLLKKLQDGAMSTAQQLRQPQTTFHAALTNAFDFDGNGHD